MKKIILATFAAALLSGTALADTSTLSERYAKGAQKLADRIDKYQNDLKRFHELYSNSEVRLQQDALAFGGPNLDEGLAFDELALNEALDAADRGNDTFIRAFGDVNGLSIDGDTVVDKIKNAFNKVANTVGQTYAGIKQDFTNEGFVENKIHKVGDIEQQTLKGVKQQVDGALGYTSADVLEGAAKIKDAVSQSYAGVKEYVAQNSEGTANGIKNSQDAVSQSYAGVKEHATQNSEGLSKVQDALNQAYAGIKEHMAQAPTSVTDGISKLQEAVGQAYAGLKDYTGRAADGTPDGIAKLQDAVNQAYAGIKEHMTKAPTSVTDGIAKVQDAVGQVYAGLKDHVDQVPEGTVGGVVKIEDGIKQTYDEVKNKINNAVDDSTAKIKTIVNDALGSGITSNDLFISPKDTGIFTSNYIGADIFTADNTNVGSIKDIVLDNGRIQAVVINIGGGFLGFGGKYVIVNPEAIKVTKDGIALKISTSITKEQFEAAPTFNYDTSK